MFTKLERTIPFITALLLILVITGVISADPVSVTMLVSVDSDGNQANH